MAAEQVTDNDESSEQERGEAPASWVGYSWYLVKKAGYGAYNGKHLLPASYIVSQPWPVSTSGALSGGEAGSCIWSDYP